MAVIKNNEVRNALAVKQPAVNPNDALAAEVKRLREENALLLAKASAKAPTGFKVADKGGVAMYGVGRFPATYYALSKNGTWEGSQWCTILMATTGMTLEATRETALYKFAAANLESIKVKMAAANAAKSAGATGSTGAGATGGEPAAF